MKEQESKDRNPLIDSARIQGFMVNQFNSAVDFGTRIYETSFSWASQCLEQSNKLAQTVLQNYVDTSKKWHENWVKTGFETWQKGIENPFHLFK